MDSIKQLKDFDNFFFYGYNDLETETKSDILQNIMQGKRTLFYDRDQDSAGAPSYENQPNGLYLQINLPYDIVTSIAKRNEYVSNGADDHPDRRVALSQSTIRIQQENDTVNVTVLYIPLNDLRQTETVSALLNTNIV